MITSLVVGRWHRYAKSGFKQNPSESAQVQIGLMLV
jgi:TetR/AcrR family transcriptional regulator